MNCGECLIELVQIVPLVDGVCPKCGADYRKPAPQSALTMEENDKLQKARQARAECIRTFGDSPDTCAMEGSETDVQGGL